MRILHYMKDNNRKVAKAVVDATANAAAIFTLTLGGILVTSSNPAELSLKAPLLTASGVALIRFALRLYKEDGINMEGMGDIAGVPGLRSDDKNNLVTWTDITNLCKII